MIELNQAEVGSVGGGRTIAGVWSDGAVPPDYVVGSASEPNPISGFSFVSMVAGVGYTEQCETIVPPLDPVCFVENLFPQNS